MRKSKENENYRTIGGRLRVFRELLGLSREQMANKSDKTVDNIEKFEKGELKSNIFIPYIHGLNRDFGLCIDWLFVGIGEKQEAEQLKRKYLGKWGVGINDAPDEILET